MKKGQPTSKKTKKVQSQSRQISKNKKSKLANNKKNNKKIGIPKQLKEQSNDEQRFQKIIPAQIKNKIKRNMILFKKQHILKKISKEKKKEQREDPNYQKGETLAIEDKREIFDELLIDDDDSDIRNEEKYDEFSEILEKSKQPKILMTTSINPSKKVYSLLKEIKNTIPHCYYYPRQDYKIQEICEYSKKRDYTTLIIFRENRKKTNELIIINLNEGPTAFFKISSIQLNKDIRNHGNASDHWPELIINNFNSMIGRRIARMIATLFPQKPEFKGRNVVTFHNQRDFIFFRRHRYIFNENGSNASMQEIGPRFTLKLMKLQKGIFDNLYGQLEYSVNTKMYSSRRKYYL